MTGNGLFYVAIPAQEKSKTKEDVEVIAGSPEKDSALATNTIVRINVTYMHFLLWPWIWICAR